MPPVPICLPHFFRRLRIFIPCLLPVLIISASSNKVLAQSPASLHSSLNHADILLGQQSELTIELSLPSNHDALVWVNFPDTFNHLEIVSRKKMDTVSQRDNILYRQQLILTGFDSGRWTIPSFSILVGNKKLKTDTLSIVVRPVQLKDSTYNDIKDIIGVPAKKTPWWYWVLGAITLAVVIAALIHFIRRRKPARADVQKEVYALSPYEQARQSLKQLRQENLPEKGESKKYFSQLQDILRLYMQRRFSGGVMQKTTDEVLIQLKSIQLPADALGRTAEALRMGDAVKFARYLPDMNQHEDSGQTIASCIDLLEKIKTN